MNKHNSLKKACIFDLDGTLTNTLHTIAHFVNAETAKYGLPPAEPEKFKHFVGNGARILIQRVLAFHGITDSHTEEDILQRYNQAYDNNFLYLCTVYDGIIDLITSLKKQHITLAVLTNKPQPTAIKTIESFFGNKTFSVVLGQREGIPIKPDPAGVFEILSTLSLKKEDCLYIGDTAVDIETGKSAGLFTVGVLWGFRDRKELETAGADAIISSPHELLAYLHSTTH